MKYNHMIKLGGKYYKPDEDVPDEAKETEPGMDELNALKAEAEKKLDELASLKAEAERRGITPHWNAGAEKIRAQIEEYDRQNGTR